MRAQVQSGDMAEYIAPLRYQFLTWFYDTVMHLTTRASAVKDELVRLANLHNGEHALELGCGTGTLSIALAVTYRDALVTGLDADLEALALAHKKARSQGVLVNLEQGIAQHLPFEASTFDVIVSSLFFHHLDRAGKRRALLEALRVTKPGGRLLIADWGRPKGVVSRLLFLPLQIRDGFATTRDNVAGLLPELIREAGFDNVHEVQAISTPLGVIRIVEALRGGSTSRPGAREVSTVLAGSPGGRPSCTSR
jgi:ubiquinone/menaquinone biosynthesis C-methylase UbiE